MEVAERFVLLHLGRNEHPEATLLGVRVSRREDDLLLDARFVLRENVHQVPEVTVKTSRAHGRADFERRLEGNDLHVKAFLLEESFGLGHVENGRIGRGKRPDFERLGRNRRRESGRNRIKKTLGEFHRNSPFILRVPPVGTLPSRVRWDCPESPRCGGRGCTPRHRPDTGGPRPP